MIIWTWIVARLGSAGAWLASAAALVAALALAALRIKAVGRAEERAAQAERGAAAVKESKEITNETDRMADDALDAANRPWVRHDHSVGG